MAKLMVWSTERGLRNLKEGVTLASYKERFPDAIRTSQTPSDKTMEKWLYAGVAKAVDGCQVEPDGECSHDCPSWLIALRLI